MSIIEKNGLKISSRLFDFINNEVIPGTTINSDDFWIKFSKIVHELAPLNKSLIQKREDIQKKIDVIAKEKLFKFSESQIEYISKSLIKSDIKIKNILNKCYVFLEGIP